MRRDYNMRPPRRPPPSEGEAPAEPTVFSDSTLLRQRLIDAGLLVPADVVRARDDERRRQQQAERAAARAQKKAAET